jgi:pimeloyl-ACP methyl ester carboxylesterase
LKTTPRVGSFGALPPIEKGVSMSAVATRTPLPLILIRGFGGLGVEDEKKVPYQGFNDGTVYPRKRGPNYIYEGMILRFMKSDWQYQDATNVIGYYGKPVVEASAIPPELEHFDKGFFYGSSQPGEDADSMYKIIVDPAMALHLLRTTEDPLRTLWVFRYYDLDDRRFPFYGQALVRLIDFIRALAAEKRGGEKPPVNIVAHSMGGLIVREAIQRAYPERGDLAADHINKVVTLGTPHQGISFNLLKEWINIDAADELKHFDPKFQKDRNEQTAYVRFSEYFPHERLLTVVGTNYHTYGNVGASTLNRLFSVSGEGGPSYNRSDGLVKQTFAQIPGCPRTFVHKCHGGPDSLVTARESFEIARRFFFGNVYARLNLIDAEIKRGFDRFGKSEIFFGVSIKPRAVDFDLFHQSPEAENTYGPFHTRDLSDADPAFGWASDARLIWEGWLDTSAGKAEPSDDLVLRLDIYVGERDSYGIGFSDNVIFHRQLYVRALLGDAIRLELHTDEQFDHVNDASAIGSEMEQTGSGWKFGITDPAFDATIGIEIFSVPESGDRIPLHRA